MKCVSLALCGLALLPLVPARAEKYALLVGIDHYPDSAKQLHGCLEDVKNVRGLLTGQLGYAEDKITVLTDEQATCGGIQENFRRQLIARARPGDEVFFYYSGHGSYIPDQSSAAAADGTEGVLCPYDVNEDQPAATLLADHQLRDLLSALPTDRVIVVLDSCHSGNITTRGGSSSTHLKAKYMRLGFDPADYNALPRQVRAPGGGAVTGAGQAGGGNPRHIILAGCAADQSAYIDEPTGSVFTQAFVRAARALNPEQATYDDLVQKLGAEMQSYLAEHGGTRQQAPQSKGFLGQTIALRSGAPTGGGSTPSAPPAGDRGRAAAEPAPPVDFPLKVWPEKNLYHTGEPMRVNVRAGKDCYLRLYYRDVGGSVQLIFPNPWQQDNRVKANQVVVIPGTKADFQFTAEAPFGSELVVAVASTSQFTDLERVRWNPGELIDYGTGPAAFAGIKTRGLKVEAARHDAGGSPTPAAAQFSESEAVLRVQAQP